LIDGEARREATFEGMPETDLLLAETPAKQDLLAQAARREVHQPGLDVFDLAAQIAHALELVRQRFVVAAKKRLGATDLGRPVVALENLVAALADAGALQLDLETPQRRAQLEHVPEDALQRRHERIHVANREVTARHRGTLHQCSVRGDG
jgi:hypothetical protein